jgi:glycosyltransferase involved in cell wall biosynthesis
MRAFEALGWEVRPFIVGDRMPAPASGRGTERLLSANPAQTLVADLARLVLGGVNARRALRELGGKVDWVYERHATLQTLGRAFQHRGVPWILETQGIFFEEARRERNSLVLTGPARRMEVSAYRDCDVLVCVSRSLKELAVEKTGADPEKILVVPNGVDTVLFDPEKHHPRRHSAEFTVGFVGTLLDWQGVDLLLRAAADLRREGVYVSTTIVGDGPARKRLERLTDELGIQEHVAFAGRVRMDEVPGYIAGFDAGYAGHTERGGAMYHSPLKLYEYAAMGKPILASDFEDARRLARISGAGLLFRPGDLEDLKRALREAVASGPRLAEMGRRIRDACIREHSWEARIRDMIPRVEEVLARRR